MGLLGKEKTVTVKALKPDDLEPDPLKEFIVSVKYFNDTVETFKVKAHAYKVDGRCVHFVIFSPRPWEYVSYKNKWDLGYRSQHEVASFQDVVNVYEDGDIVTKVLG